MQRNGSSTSPVGSQARLVPKLLPGALLQPRGMTKEAAGLEELFIYV